MILTGLRVCVLVCLLVCLLWLLVSLVKIYTAIPLIPRLWIYIYIYIGSFSPKTVDLYINSLYLDPKTVDPYIPLIPGLWIDTKYYQIFQDCGSIKIPLAPRLWIYTSIPVVSKNGQAAVGVSVQKHVGRLFTCVETSRIYLLYPAYIISGRREWSKKLNCMFGGLYRVLGERYKTVCTGGVHNPLFVIDAPNM